MLATNIDRRTKATLFKRLVLSVQLYGYETLKLSKEEENTFDIFQISKIRWQQRVMNKQMLEFAGT